MRSARKLVLVAGFALATLLALSCSSGGAPAGVSGTGKPSGAAAPAAATSAPAAPVAAAAATSETPPAPEQIRIAYSTTSLSFATLFIAQDRGYYARNGLEAELLQATPQVAQAGMMNGDVTFSMSFGSQIRGAARGLPIRVVEQSVTAPLLMLVARPEIATIPDLRGRVLAVTTVGGNNSQTALLLLRKYGVDPQSVQYVAAGDSPKQMELLRQGQAAAALVSPPWPYLARREGFVQLANALEEVELPFTGLGTSLDVLARRPDVVRRTIRAEIEALRHMHAERADTIRLFEERFAMEPELAAQAYDMIMVAHTRDGSISRAGIENLLAVEKEDGAIPEHARFEDVVELGPLAEVQRAMGLVP